MQWLSWDLLSPSPWAFLCFSPVLDSLFPESHWIYVLDYAFDLLEYILK